MDSPRSFHPPAQHPKMDQTIPSQPEQDRSRGPTPIRGRRSELNLTPPNGPPPPQPAAVRPRPGPFRIEDLTTMAVVDLRSVASEDVELVSELVPAGLAVAELGGERPIGRRIVDLSASIDESGPGSDERWEPFELSRSTAELLTGVQSHETLVGEQPPDVGGEPRPAEGTPWPEIRFYLGSAALFFLAFIVATAFWVALPTVLLGWDPTAITSGSMEPAIRAGDVVIGNPDVPEDLAIGSVVTFEASTGKLITHRVVGTTQDGAYITRGDSNSDPDRPAVDPEDIRTVGRILVPYAGYPSVWAQSGSWWAVLLLAIAAAGLVTASRWALLDRYNPWSDTGQAQVEAAGS